MGTRNNAQQVQGNPMPQGMLGPPGTQQQPRDASANMAYPWMQAGKWAGMNGAANTDSALQNSQALRSGGTVATGTEMGTGTGGPGGNGYVAPATGTGGPGGNGYVPPVGGQPGGAPAVPGVGTGGIPGVGPEMSQGDYDSGNFTLYNPNQLDPRGIPVVNDPSTWPNLPGDQQWYPTANQTPRDSFYGINAPSVAQMQNAVAALPPITEGVPGNDRYVALRNSLGRTPTEAENQRNAQVSGINISQYYTDPMWTAMGPGGLTRGQTQLMTLQKGGMLPKDTFI